MYYYKLTVEYIGSHYSGFQYQKNLKTIQNELNHSIALLTNEKFSTFAASRTDSGVHALNQIVKLTILNPLDVDSIHKLNEILPKDIHIKKIEFIPTNFHPTKDYQLKEYRYFFTNHKIPQKTSPFIANIANPLDMNKINECVKLIIGKNDFCNFYSKGSNVKSTVRTIEHCSISLINPKIVFNDYPFFKIDNDINECYQFIIIGDGFLKQMNRHLISALWSVGSGKMDSDKFKLLLHSKKIDKQLWKVASPNGLFLFNFL